MPEPWSMPHELHIFNQVQRRPADDEWWEAKPSGLVHLLCNCGYSTGWIPSDQMPSPDQLLADHGRPFKSIIA